MQLIAAALTLLLLAGPSVAQDKKEERYDWAVRVDRPSNGFLDGQHGSKATIEDEPCCGPLVPGDWPAFDKSPILKQLAGKVARDGDVLRLALDGGRTLKITGCSNFDVCQTDPFYQWLAGWWPATRHYIVGIGVVYTDWHSLRLISQKDGSSTSLISSEPVSKVPILSPSGRYAIAFHSTIVTGFQTEIIDLATDPPKTVWVAKPTCAGFDPEYSLLPQNAVWADDNHVRFEGDAPWASGTRYRVYQGKLILRIGPGPDRPQWEC